MIRAHGSIDMKTIFDRFEIPGIIHLFSTNEGVGLFELLIRICNMYYQRELLRDIPRVFCEWNGNADIVYKFTRSAVFYPDFIMRETPWYVSYV